MDFLHPSSWQGGFSGYYVPVESHSTRDEMERIETSTKCMDERTTTWTASIDDSHSNTSFSQDSENPNCKMSIVRNANKSSSITQLTTAEHQRVQ